MRSGAGVAKARRLSMVQTTMTDKAKLPSTNPNPYTKPAHNCYYKCTGHYLVCVCGAWNSTEYQARNRCYMCGQKILRDLDEINSDIATAELRLAMLKLEALVYVPNQ
jgi:hypothetical protein